MKAWNDLKSNPDRQFFKTKNSEYWIGTGTKIERFDDGTIELKNIMSQGDSYDDMTESQLFYFNTYGWFPGMYKVLVDTFSDKLIRTDVKVRKAKTPEEAEVMRVKLVDVQTKLDSYKINLNKALKSAKQELT